ncbi:MAG: sensor histidine kinase [Gemmatimonadota bacterium]
MVERQRIPLLIIILTVVAIGAAGIAIRALYATAIEQTLARLTETVQSQARLLESVARFNEQWGLKDVAYAATIAEAEDARERFQGFGRTGELSLARRVEDTIVYVLRHRHSDLLHPVPVPFDSRLDEPMRRALSGESGTMTALDYRGEMVFAAYEPVGVLNLGMVAKIDRVEIRAPFVRAGALAGGAALVLIALGAVLFRRITDPLIRNLERRVAERTADLARANRELESEIAERRQAEQRLLLYQDRLRSMASELILTEERERRRFATDLHDHIGQTLAVVQMKIDALQAPAGTGPGGPSLGDVSALIDRMDEDIRSLTFELSPPVLYELGLTAGLEWLSEQLQAQHGLPIQVEDDREPKPLDDDVRTLIFRAVRELLVNVIKHARASGVTVSLERDGDRICATVSDDGIGFDTAAQTGSRDGGGFGLFSIRERMSSIGGAVEIRSTPGHGTWARLTAPLTAAGHPAWEGDR